MGCRLHALRPPASRQPCGSSRRTAPPLLTQRWSQSAHSSEPCCCWSCLAQTYCFSFGLNHAWHRHFILYCIIFHSAPDQTFSLRLVHWPYSPTDCPPSPFLVRVQETVPADEGSHFDVQDRGLLAELSCAAATAGHVTGHQNAGCPSGSRGRSLGPG